MGKAIKKMPQDLEHAVKFVCLEIEKEIYANEHEDNFDMVLGVSNDSNSISADDKKRAVVWMAKQGVFEIISQDTGSVFHLHVIYMVFDAMNTIYFSDIKKSEVVKTEAVNPKEKIANITKGRVYAEGEVGYIKFEKKRKIKIGKFMTRKYKLLHALFLNQGVMTDIDEVFEKIILEKDKNNALLNDEYTAMQEKRNIILNTMKEVNRIKLLKGVLRIKWSEDKQYLKIVIT